MSISTDEMARAIHAISPRAGWRSWDDLTLDERDAYREEAAKLRDELHTRGFAIEKVRTP